MTAVNHHHVEAARRPVIAKPLQQVQLRRAPYFAALSRIDAGRRMVGARAAAHLDENPGGAIDGNGVDLARTVAHIAGFDAQAAAAQVGAGPVLGGLSLALARTRTDSRGGRRCRTRTAGLHVCSLE